jgi:hypothetical protein
MLAMAVVIGQAAAGQDEPTWQAPVTEPGGPIVMKVVMVEDLEEDPAAAGRQAAEKLQKAMGQTPLKAVVVSECFEDRPYKEKLLAGLGSVLDREMIFGAATYGSFTHQGCTDFDSVCLLGIGGKGIGVAATLVTDMGTSQLTLDQQQNEIEKRLRSAGQQLARQIPRSQQDRLLILLPDAHSPKNQYLVEGVQHVLGKQFPMTGGSANKNAGQTFIYFGGRMYRDSAVALMLSGDFQVAMAGRQGKDEETVIRTAREGAEQLMEQASGQPVAILAYNCAGRRGKLTDMKDELAAIEKAIGKATPLFGCYNAGEIGPLDESGKDPEARCGGSGWHVMFTAITR